MAAPRPLPVTVKFPLLTSWLRERQVDHHRRHSYDDDDDPVAVAFHRLDIAHHHHHHRLARNWTGRRMWWLEMANS